MLAARLVVVVAVAAALAAPGAVAAGGRGMCVRRWAALPEPPAAASLAPTAVREALRCWATRGTFRNDPTLYVDEWWPAPPRRRACASSPSVFARRAEAGVYWEPDASCPLPYAHLNDARDVCRTVAGRGLLLVGDTLTLQLFEALQTLVQRALVRLGGQAAAHVWDTTNQDSAFACYGPPEDASEAIFCQATLCKHSGYVPFNLTFVRNDRLSDVLNLGKTSNEHGEFWQNAWLPHLYNNSIVVLNRGARYAKDDELTVEYERALHMVNSTLFGDGNTAAGRLVFVRNTPPGHPDCMQYVNTQPDGSRPDAGPAAAVLPGHWGDFARQNALVRALVEERFGPRFLVLDVDTVTAQRRDSHVDAQDCLHYCRPGPVDFWAELLVNAIRAASAMA